MWIYQLEVTCRGQLTSLSAGLKGPARAEVMAGDRVRIESPGDVAEQSTPETFPENQKCRWGWERECHTEGG